MAKLKDAPITPKYSQTQGYGMVPVYEQQGGRAGERGEPVFLGYEFNPIAAGLEILEAPKPVGVIAEEKRLGTTMEPIYQTYTTPRGGRDGDNPETIQYGPPIGYRYDNGKSQYVNFDAGGQFVNTQDRKKSSLADLWPILAILAIPFVGPSLLPSVFGAGAAGAGAAGATLGALEGALTVAEIAALPGAATLAGAATGAGLLADTAALGAGGGGLLGEAAVLGGAGEVAAAANLTPAAIESLLGTAGYGVNASALEAALAAGIPAAQVGAGALLPFPGAPTPIPTPPPQLTPAAIESGLGTPGYGANASAIESGLFNPELIGAGAAIGAPLTLPSWATVPNALLAANVASGIAKANETAPTAPTFTMAPYVPPSGKPFANLGMSPIATPYTPTRIAGQYDPTKTPGGVSPYELIMAQMQAPKNLYADFEAGTNIGGYDPQRFVVPPAAAATAPPNNMGGMINKSRMVGPNPMGPDNGFASIQDGEFVMNRKATQKYGIELMNAINSGKISKGKLFGLLEA